MKSARARLRSAIAITVLGLLAATACASETDPSAPDTASTAASQTAAAKAGWRSQIIYLVMPDRFRNGDTGNDDAGAPSCHDAGDPQRFHGGDLEGLRKNLGYVRELGATAVWVTPLYRQIGRQANDNCGYHGYWADYAEPYDDAIEPKLGDDAALGRLVSDMHASGMRFILDMVVNHTGDTARLPQQRPDWFHDPRSCARLGDPTIFCPLDRHPDFIQERAEVATYLSNVAKRWTTRAALDGIRMDTAKHVPTAYFSGSFFPAVRAGRSDLFAVAEAFDDGSIDSGARYVDAGFDSTFHFPLRRALVDGIAKSGSVDRIASAVASGIARLGMDRALDLVIFADNHDVPRFVNEPGLGVPEDEIRRRTLLALDLVFTLPGIPQLYYGDEIGMYGGGDPDNRRDLPAWATDAAARGLPHPGQAVAGAGQVFARVQKLAALRKTTPAFIDGAYRELWRQNGPQNPNVYAFARGAGADARIVVISNGAAPSGTMRIPVPPAIFPDGTRLVDELGDGAPPSTTLDQGRLVVSFPGRSAAIYKRAL